MAEVVRCPYLSSAQTTAQKGPWETAAMLQFQDGVWSERSEGRIVVS